MTFPANPPMSNESVFDDVETMVGCIEGKHPEVHSAPLDGQRDQNSPDIENCSHGIAPDPNTAGKQKKMIVPVVTSMTKYLFDHYRLTMYSYLNRALRNGTLHSLVPFGFSNKSINREVCTFRDVTYWRIDRLNFWADVNLTLTLHTGDGVRQWNGVLSFWFSAEQAGPLTGTIEDLCSMADGPDREDMVLLSPYLIPYFTSPKMDMEAELLWHKYVPGFLEDIEQRRATTLAKAMGLSIRHLPLYKHQTVNSVLFLIDDTVLVSENGKPPVEEFVLANTIVINSNVVHKDYSDFNIFHECVHFYEHYLFFRLQQMHTNDVLRMETKEVDVDTGKITNPLYWMEKQANRGAYGLMLPVSLMREKMSDACSKIDGYAHEGEKYEKIGLAVAEAFHLPHFRIRARMIQLGHIYAKGALNYVDRSLIQPFSFDAESLRAEEHTFVIDRLTASYLYEMNNEFRQVLDTGKFVYADGHIVRNEPRFVEETPSGHMLTPWASKHVDQCCLRFVRIYEQHNAARYVFGRMNYDPDYVRQTMFYLDDLINGKELDEIEAELVYKREFPQTFLEAFDMLMKKNNDNGHHSLYNVITRLRETTLKNKRKMR